MLLARLEGSSEFLLATLHETLDMLKPFAGIAADCILDALQGGNIHLEGILECLKFVKRMIVDSSSFTLFHPILVLTLKDSNSAVREVSSAILSSCAAHYGGAIETGVSYSAADSLTEKKETSGTQVADPVHGVQRKCSFDYSLLTMKSAKLGFPSTS